MSVLPVHATNERGLYFTFTGSMDLFEGMNLTGQDPSFNTAIKARGASAEIKNGLGFNHSIGYQFGNSFSTELEFAYKNGDFEKVTGDGGISNLHGDITSKSFLKLFLSVNVTITLSAFSFSFKSSLKWRYNI